VGKGGLNIMIGPTRIEFCTGLYYALSYEDQGMFNFVTFYVLSHIPSFIHKCALPEIFVES